MRTKANAKRAASFWCRSSRILKRPGSVTFLKSPTPSQATRRAVVRSRRGPSAKRCAWIKLSSLNARACRAEAQRRRKRRLQPASSHSRRQRLEFPLPSSQRKMEQCHGRASRGSAMLSLSEFRIHLITMNQTAESRRLAAANANTEPWRRFGPYLSERQWGTVREDYSPHGNAWGYLPHDHG